jgi:hypothetical protein
VPDTGLAGWDAGPAPRTDPLTYPGRWPPRSILHTDQALLPLDMLADRPLGLARVGRATTLDEMLLLCGSARADERTPVLAVGSNASPAQLRHKYRPAGIPSVMPMVRAWVEGLAAGVAPVVARAGYVPATPVLGPDLGDELFVQWLDPAQLARLDATEGNYRRVLLAAGDPSDGGVRITLPSGEVLGTCHVYTCTRGSLTLDPLATPLRLTDQASLLERLLATSPDLHRLMGGTPATWIERAAAPGMADAVHAVFRAEGWVAEPLCL